MKTTVSSETEWIGQGVDGLDTPAVLVDLDLLEQNIAAMARFAAEQGVALRPHAKTHKSPAIAHRQLEAGAVGITVAKLDEAESMLDAGIDDIFIAYQIVGKRKIKRLLEVSQRGRVASAVDSLPAASALSEAAVRAGRALDVLIEVDTGLRRCGLPPGEPVVRFAQSLVQLPGLRLVGIFTHAGHVYGASTPRQVETIGVAEGEVMVETATMMRDVGLDVPIVSIGSTPTVRFGGRVDGVTEIRPGNYVFYDRMQVALGAATVDTCALTVLATVISRPTSARAVIDAGSKVFSSDRGAHGGAGIEGYGEVCGQAAIVARLSEEHGVLDLRGAELHVGDRVQVLPNHACAVVGLARRLLGVRNGVVEEVLALPSRGGVQ